MRGPLLDVQNLVKFFPISGGNLQAVDDVSFSLQEGETLGVVGESGCGKSTLGRTILRLIEPTGGKILFDGTDILDYRGKALRKLRREMQIIFQDPYASLNPRMTVSQIIADPLIVNGMKVNLEDRVGELVDKVGLSKRLLKVYPHELDGGRRQRIGVARALALNPKFIVCDEPVSSLDVSIQAQILNLLMDLQDEMGLTYMFITHDLSVARHISDVILVMYLGRMVEKAPAKILFEKPLHPYTRALLSAIPVPRLRTRKKESIILKSEVTSPVNPPPGCRFAPRCNLVEERCRQAAPLFKEVGPDHYVACMMVD